MTSCQHPTAPINRRQALASITALAGISQFPGLAAIVRRKPKVAAIVTDYRNNTHADVICGKILEGFRQDGGVGPELELVSMFTDQVNDGDLSRSLEKKHGFKITGSIEEAITLGTNKLQVQGVLSIGEHGNYPFTPDTKQHMYPRARFFKAITETFRKTGKVAPVFNDKHLAYNWADAKQMYDTAARMKIPFMAGSSLPVTWRKPQSVFPIGTPIEEALVYGYGGLEAYGFHMLETMQCVVERRQGGESGVESVQVLRGEAAWQASQQGRWSFELLKAAVAGSDIEIADEKLIAQVRSPNSAVYLMKYRDKIPVTGAMIPGVGGQFSLAMKLPDQEDPFVSWFQLEDKKPYGHFEYLLRAIEEMFQTGKPSYPVERTLLTTGILDRVMHSVANDGISYRTPELAIRYQPVEWPYANQAGGNPYPC